MLNLLDIELQIKKLYETKTLASWYQLFEIDKVLVDETWSADLLYANEAESLVVMATNCSIDIAQNYLTKKEDAEITAFIQGKLDRGEM